MKPDRQDLYWQLACDTVMALSRLHERVNELVNLPREGDQLYHTRVCLGHRSFQCLTVTAAQAAIAEKLVLSLFPQMTEHDDSYEIKEVSWSLISDKVMSLTVEVGLVGDEGTMASIFGRSRKHVFIGPRDGTSTYTRAGKKLHGWRALSHIDR